MSLVSGCKIISNEKKVDNRGFFSRIFSIDDVGNFRCKQTSIAHNDRARTIRGLHMQDFPVGENKIVSCISGSVDVFVLDARIGSPTYKNVYTTRLSNLGDSIKTLYVPRYCAFGYITITDNCTLIYYMDEYFTPDKQIGYNILDKNLGIQYDFGEVIMSDKDRSNPDFIGGI